MFTSGNVEVTGQLQSNDNTESVNNGINNEIKKTGIETLPVRQRAASINLVHRVMVKGLVVLLASSAIFTTAAENPEPCTMEHFYEDMEIAKKLGLPIDYAKAEELQEWAVSIGAPCVRYAGDSRVPQALPLRAEVTAVNATSRGEPITVWVNDCQDLDDEQCSQIVEDESGFVLSGGADTCWAYVASHHGGFIPRSAGWATELMEPCARVRNVECTEDGDVCKCLEEQTPFVSGAPCKCGDLYEQGDDAIQEFYKRECEPDKRKLQQNWVDFRYYTDFEPVYTGDICKHSAIAHYHRHDGANGNLRRENVIFTTGSYNQLPPQGYGCSGSWPYSERIGFKRYLNNEIDELVTMGYAPTMKVHVTGNFIGGVTLFGIIGISNPSPGCEVFGGGSFLWMWTTGNTACNPRTYVHGASSNTFNAYTQAWKPDGLRRLGAGGSSGPGKWYASSGCFLITVLVAVGILYKASPPKILKMVIEVKNTPKGRQSQSPHDREYIPIYLYNPEYHQWVRSHKKRTPGSIEVDGRPAYLTYKGVALFKHEHIIPPQRTMLYGVSVGQCFTIEQRTALEYLIVDVMVRHEGNDAIEQFVSDQSLEVDAQKEEWETVLTDLQMARHPTWETLGMDGADYTELVIDRAALFGNGRRLEPTTGICATIRNPNPPAMRKVLYAAPFGKTIRYKPPIEEVLS